MIPKGTLVMVEWEDISSSGDWNEDPDLATASIQTPGWVARDTDKRYRDFHLAQSRSIDEETLHDHTSFPTGCITSIRCLATGAELWDLSKPDEEPDA